MRLLQLGNGGAFDYDKTNSSFIIEMDKSNLKYRLLFDCGYNVFGKLRELGDELITSLSAIFISHMDDDHIGSLKSLIYYRYFILKKYTTILCGADVIDELAHYLKDVNQMMHNGKSAHVDMYTIKRPEQIVDFSIKTIDTNHGKPCHGLKIVDHDSKQMLLISGDTKANMHFYRELKRIPKDYKALVFHDYSEFNSESDQVHACYEDFNLIYADYLDLIIKYHNNDDYETEWVNMVDQLYINEYINDNHTNVKILGFVNGND